MTSHHAPESGPRRFKPYPLYKDSGVEWLGEIPEHWNLRRLRATMTACQNGVWGEEPSGRNDMPCVRVADFDRVTFRVDTSDLTLRSIEKRDAQVRALEAGDLLLEKSGGGDKQPVGAVVLYDHDVAAVCSNFIARMPVADGFSPRFLVYLHAALYAARINVRSIKQSTGIQNLDSGSYLSERAGFPEFQEQRAIAAFLDRETAKIDALVAKKERLIELLQEKRTALITHAVTKGLDPNVRTRDSGAEWLGEIPAHWEILQLRRVIQKFVDYRGKTPEKTPSGVRLVTAKNIKSQTIDFSLSEEFIPRGLYGKWMVRGLPERGDVLVTTEAPLGESAQIDDPNIALAQRIVLLKANKAQITNDYLMYHFASDSGRSELWSRATGSTAHGIKASHLKATLLPVPPVSEQERITSHIVGGIADIDTMILKIRDGIDRLKELRTALVSSAVTGKIDVRREVV